MEGPIVTHHRDGLVIGCFVGNDAAVSAKELDCSPLDQELVARPSKIPNCTGILGDGRGARPEYPTAVARGRPACSLENAANRLRFAADSDSVGLPPTNCMTTNSR